MTLPAPSINSETGEKVSTTGEDVIPEIHIIDGTLPLMI